MQDIAGEAVCCGGSAGLDRLAAEDGKAGMFPGEQEIHDGRGDFLFGQQGLEELVAEQARQLLSVDPGDGMEAAVWGNEAVGDKTVEVGVEKGWISAIGLDRDNGAGEGVFIL